MYGLCVKNASKDNYKLHTGSAKLFHISVEIGIMGIIRSFRRRYSSEIG